MPRASGSRNLTVVVSTEQLEAVRQFSEAHGYNVVADFVREAIFKAMEAEGMVVDMSVNRGGYRRETS